MENAHKLDALREQIDDVDKNLIELIALRLKLVKEAAEVKKDLGSGTFNPERERFLLESRHDLAAMYDLPEGLIEDILKRLLRESYRQGGIGVFPCAQKEAKPVLIVGGNGGMGKLLGSFFKNSGYEVRILDKDDWDKAEALFSGVGTVIVSVPINVTDKTIKKISQYLTEDTVLADVTSVKTGPINAMLSAHKGPVIGLHPMFGPDTRSFVKQVVVCVDGRMPQKCEFLVNQFKIWGANICSCKAREHDSAMSIIQALRHFTTYCYGVFLAKLNPDLQNILNLSSPIYRLEIEMVGRLFAQDPHLYADIIMSSKDNADLIKDYVLSLKSELDIVLSQDKEEFIKRFYFARSYFGDYAQSFLKESAKLLAKMQDDRS